MNLSSDIFGLFAMVFRFIQNLQLADSLDTRNRAPKNRRTENHIFSFALFYRQKLKFFALCQDFFLERHTGYFFQGGRQLSNWQLTFLFHIQIQVEGQFNDRR